MVQFIELTKLFKEFEKITPHKGIVSKIANFLQELEIKEVKESAYLFLGSMGSAFESTTLEVGDKLALRFPRFLRIRYDKGPYDIHHS